MLCPQWQPQTMENTPVTTNSTLEKQIQEDFCQRAMSQDGTQQPFSSDWRLSNCTATSIDPALPKPAAGGFEQVTGNIHYLRQIKWLLLLFHAKTCTYPVGSCKFHGCVQNWGFLLFAKCVHKRQGIPCNGQLGVLPLPPRRRPFRSPLQHQLTRRGLLRQPGRCLPWPREEAAAVAQGVEPLGPDPPPV
jgi:hypothetical protein|uniref:Uncharacterized protein n=1 Tax=Zea mays TaxID=4577 RepID=A0A804NQP6_MAIZE